MPRIKLAARRAHINAASGGEGDRTPDLVNAIHALSQLSYAPPHSKDLVLRTWDLVGAGGIPGVPPHHHLVLSPQS